MDEVEGWDSPSPAPVDDAALYLELDGWEGPLDLLLDLARRQKVDLQRDLDPRAGRPVPRLHRAGARRCGSSSPPITW